MTCALSKDSNQPGYALIPIRVSAGRLTGSAVITHDVTVYGESTNLRWSHEEALADAQADLSLHLAHMSFWWFCHASAHMGLEEVAEKKNHISGLIDLSGCAHAFE